MAKPWCPPGMRRLRIPVPGDGRHDFPGHPDTPAVVVSGDVVDDHPEERRQRSRSAARARPEAIPDRLDLAAQVAKCDGATGARLADRPG